jgi:hypothetical protein
MKKNLGSSLKQFAVALLAIFVTAVSVHAADVTISNSVVALATNGTVNYTFTDPTTAQSVVVAVTLTPYSPTGTATFSALDGETRVGLLSVNGFKSGQGANLSATLVSRSSGVTASSVKFRVASLGVRAADGGGTLNWTSSVAGISVVYTNTADALQSLDTTNYSVNGATYSAQIRFPVDALFQFTDADPLAGLGLVLNAQFTTGNFTDPHTNSWFTNNTGLYARIYTTDANRTNGVTQTTWTNTINTLKQSTPAYRGVQEIYTSTDWIYFRTTGFGQHIMGPWYDTTARTVQFVNLPVNQKLLFRIPRTNGIPSVKTPTYGATEQIGYFVDGVAMYDALDGNVWTGTNETTVPGNTYQWRRAAYPNESLTFDPAYTHQQNTGNYHNHADPLALRYLLGDHVDFNATTKIYSESTSTNLVHSPILGWVRDGLPIYGPYGYINPTNASSGIRRMISGYQLRNGTNGSDNITTVGRTNLPAWTLRNNGNVTGSGPNVSTTYPIGRYLQDYAYLGDLTNTATSQKYQLGSDFDLNEYCCRFCVTPEYPAGTYAYFVTIDSTGTPAAPWNVGMYFYANPVGTKWTNITETVTTNFIGGPNAALTVSTPSNNNYSVTLTWSAVEGGTYQVASSTNNVNFTTNVTALAGSSTLTYLTTNYTGTNGLQYARVQRTALANFDTAGTAATTNQTATQSFTIAKAAVTTPPASVSVSQNSSATFTVLASGSGTVTYQWRKNSANISSATNSSLTIASAQSTDVTSYVVVVSNFTGSVTSSAASLSITNYFPTAIADSITRTSNLTAKIYFTNLLVNDTDPDSDTLFVSAVNLTTTNGITLTTNSTTIFYPNAANVADQFTYTVSDGHGGTATGTANISVVTVAGTNSVLSLQVGVPGSGTNTLTFAGVPGYSYVVQYATNVTGPWQPFSTNTAATNGLWTAIDRTATNTSRFYRAAF